MANVIITLFVAAVALAILGFGKLVGPLTDAVQILAMFVIIFFVLTVIWAIFKNLWRIRRGIRVESAEKKPPHPRDGFLR